jgi:hypothetical protein
MEKNMFSQFATLGFSEKFFIGFVAVGLAVTFSDQFSQSSRQAGIQSAQEKCLKEAEELKANALPHEVWKKVPPICDPGAISKLEQKTSTQKAILEMTDEQKTNQSFPSIIWFILIGLIPTIVRIIRRQISKIDKNG